jgi:hypothetical protein
MVFGEGASQSQEFDRTSDEYFSKLFKQTVSPVFGVRAERPPADFEDLVLLVASARNPTCDISEEIDKSLEIIAASERRDEIARALPYYQGSIAFIIPELGESP